MPCRWRLTSFHMPSTPSCIAVVTATPQSSQSLLSHKASRKPRRHNGTRQPNATLRETSWSRRSTVLHPPKVPSQARVVVAYTKLGQEAHLQASVMLKPAV
ncbi:hypothetical protein FSOLCH5_009360 [Fusarium solani]